MATLKMKIEFKRFLEENAAFESYVLNLEDEFASFQGHVKHDLEKYKEDRINILNGYSSNSFKNFLQSSFTWRLTPEGYNYWSKLSENYHK